MGDDENETSSQTTGGTFKKKVPKKKHYPFGTPSHKHQPYSLFNHLRKEDVLLFHELSMSAEIQAEIRTGEEEKERLKKVHSVKKVDDDFLKYAQPTKEEGSDQCKRIDCRNVLRKIMESMSTLQQERDAIHDDLEHLDNEAQMADQENSQLEDRLRMTTRENDQLEATLEHLSTQIAKLESKKLDLQQEREEFGNKMMVTETEKQNWIRQVQLAHKGLADAMWRGQRQDIQTTATEIVIKPRDPKCVDYDRATSTSYNSMASGGVIDFSERPLPPPTSSIPLYLKAELLRSQSLSQWGNDTRSLRGATGSAVIGGGSVFSASTFKTAATGRLMPLSPDQEAKIRRKILKLNKDNSPFVSTHGDAYRGYTPSGAPVNRARSPYVHAIEARSTPNMSLLSVKKSLSRSMPSLDRKRLAKTAGGVSGGASTFSFSGHDSERKLLLTSHFCFMCSCLCLRVRVRACTCACEFHFYVSSF